MPRKRKEAIQLSSSTPVAAHGSIALWIFKGTNVGVGESNTVHYHQRAPQLYHPVDVIAPFIVAASKIVRPTTIEKLRSGPDFKGSGVPVPGIGYTHPRYATTESVNLSANALVRSVPPCDPITRFDALLWAFWSELQYGPFRPDRRVKARTKTGGQPLNTAFVWEFMDDIDGPLHVAFTAYDARGQPVPFLTVASCPVDQFAVDINTSSTLTTLAGL